MRQRVGTPYNQTVIEPESQTAGKSESHRAREQESRRIRLPNSHRAREHESQRTREQESHQNSRSPPRNPSSLFISLCLVPRGYITLEERRTTPYCSYNFLRRPFSSIVGIKYHDLSVSRSNKKLYTNCSMGWIIIIADATEPRNITVNLVYKYWELSISTIVIFFLAMVLFRLFACDERWCFLFEKCVHFSRRS